jgi:hypothetical protein
MRATDGSNGFGNGGPDPDSAAAIAPEDSFLIQVRGGSRPAERAVSGRIEHLHSGTSEPFGTLAEMLDFLARHFGLHVTAQRSNREEEL